MGHLTPPQEKCPYCGELCDAEWIGTGVGLSQVGPYHCYNCGATQIGPELFNWVEYDEQKRDYVLKDGHPFSEIELKTGFYKPEYPLEKLQKWAKDSEIEAEKIEKN